MKIPFRTARSIADELIGVPFLTPRQRERQTNIITVATELFARYGKDHCSMGLVAHALRIAVQTLRWHYSDLDAVLYEILRAHLAGLSKYLGDVPRDPPNYQQRKRAAFLQYTRPCGDFTTPHLLLVRDRASLPRDLLEAIETTYQALGAGLAGDWGTDVLEMLDTARFDAEEIETRLTTLSNPSPPAPGAIQPVTKPTPAWQTPAP
jgi:AcrR family transcriptional regulator